MTNTRITKKLVALATTVLMLAAMLIPVTAAPGVPEGKIIVHKYYGDDIENATANNTGAAQTPHADFTALEGAGFKVFHVPDAAVEGLLDKLVQAIPEVAEVPEGPDGTPAVPAIPEVPAVTVTNHTIDATGVTATEGAPTITWNLSDGTTYTTTAVAVAWGAEQLTDATGKIEFTGPDADGAASIPDGYYVLVETTVPEEPEDLMPSAPSLIRMPMTNTDGSLNYAVNVYPKNVSSKDIVTKVIDGLEKPVTTGDIVDFILTSKFRGATVNSAADLRATDAPSENAVHYGTAAIEERFTTHFEQEGNNDDIVVKFINAAGDFVGDELEIDVDYTIERTAATEEDGEIIKVSLTPAGIDKAIEETAAGFGFTISAKYTGTPTAGIGKAAKVENDAASFVGAPGEVIIDPPTTTVHVPTISVEIEKVDQDGAPLEGATFKIATAAQPTAAQFLKDADGNDLVVTTDETGFAAFSNLPGYTNANGAKYYIIETAAPAGYNGGTVVSVTWANKAGYMASNPGFFIGTDGDEWGPGNNLVEPAHITNTLLGTENPHSPGFSLPLTGGAGTLAFTVIGVLVMLGAAVVYLRGKKRNV